MTTILAIESSCDDTSAAVLRDRRVLSNVIASQKVHEQYGGVVPELASRAHQQNIIPVVDAAIRQAAIAKEEIDAVGFTRGPGLLGSLLVGVSFAKSFATAIGKPLVEVNHLQAHVLSHFIERGEPMPQFPFICLLVSGGHTQILLLRDYFDIECLGTTIDDAAGEAIDKAAKIMDLGYPGGPVIDRLAKEGNADAYTFATPHIAGYDYSFSGIKTSSQGRPLRLHPEDHSGLPPQEGGTRRHRPPCAPAGHSRRRQRQQPAAQRAPAHLPEAPLAGLHTALQLLHRQRRHGGHRRHPQIRTRRLRRHIVTAIHPGKLTIEN